MKLNYLTYIPDDQLYSLWKLSNILFVNRKDVFNFDDLLAPSQSLGGGTLMLLLTLRNIGVNLPRGVFHKDIYADFNHDQFIQIQKWAEEQPASPFSIALKRILTNDFRENDIERIALKGGTRDVLEYIEFAPKLPEKSQKKLSAYVENYIKTFIEDHLVANEQNYFKFAKQETLLREIFDYNIEAYGNSFILRERAEMTHTAIFIRDFLLIHTIIAFERLNYISIESAWTRDDVPPEKQTEEYKLRINIKERYYAAKDKLQTIKESDQGLIIAKKLEGQVQPLLAVEGTSGYFKFHKRGERIKIGGIKTRKFRLLQALVEPISVAKTIDIVFEAIKVPRDEKDGRLNDSYLSHTRKVELIEFAIKEIQKIKKLQGRVRFPFGGSNKQTIRMEMI